MNMPKAETLMTEQQALQLASDINSYYGRSDGSYVLATVKPRTVANGAGADVHVAVTYDETKTQFTLIDPTPLSSVISMIRAIRSAYVTGKNNGTAAAVSNISRELMDMAKGNAA